MYSNTPPQKKEKQIGGEGYSNQAHVYRRCWNLYSCYWKRVRQNDKYKSFQAFSGFQSFIFPLSYHQDGSPKERFQLR